MQVAASSVADVSTNLDSIAGSTETASGLAREGLEMFRKAGIGNAA